MPDIRSTSRSLALTSVVLYLLLAAAIFCKIRANNDGHFLYALDDPYIHLALSEQLAHGHYGLNAGEAASPSSSIVWPFLLVPFAGSAAHLYLPLLWNLVFGAMAVWLIAEFAGRLPGFAGSTQRTQWAGRLLVTLLLVVAGNLVSLTFVGMEHVLQVLLSVVCALGLIRTWDESRVPVWCMAAAAVAPAVRYESLLITAAVCLVLAGLRQWGKAAGLMAAAVIPLVAFGVFLHTRGLPPLPMSVLVKGHAYRNGGHGLATAAQMLKDNLHSITDRPIYWPLVLMGLTLAYAWYRENDRTRRFILAAGVLVAAGQIAVGKFGWFNRYEVYAVIFAALILVRVVKAPQSLSFSYMAVALFYVGSPYLAGTRNTAGVTREIYEQQYQMHRFVSDFYRQSVAVNDLGLVSFEKPAGVYVLDVYGLASPEASKNGNKTADWLKDIVARHGVGLAILYPGWFRIPTAWMPVAKMCNSDEVKVVGDRCVVFYSTDSISRAQIRTEMTEFAKGLPSGVILQMDPPLREGGVLLPLKP